MAVVACSRQQGRIRSRAHAGPARRRQRSPLLPQLTPRGPLRDGSGSVERADRGYTEDRL